MSEGGEFDESKKCTDNEVKKNKLNSHSNPNDQIDNREWSTNEMIEKLDQELEDKASKFNMTAIQVRSLLYNVLRDKRVITLAQAKARDIPITTETEMSKNSSELLQLLDLDLPFTRLRNRKKQDTIETHLPSDDSDDSLYEPSERSDLTVEENETTSHDDDYFEENEDIKNESTVTSILDDDDDGDRIDSVDTLKGNKDSLYISDIINPLSSTMMSKETSLRLAEHQKSIEESQKAWKSWIFEVGDESMTTVGALDFSILSKSQSFNYFKHTHETSRRKLPPTNFSPIQDKNLHATTNNITEEDDDDAEDEDFVYDIDELDDEDDEEEYRQDKAVRVSKKEYLGLMETVEENVDVDIDSFFILADKYKPSKFSKLDKKTFELQNTTTSSYSLDFNNVDPSLNYNIKLDDNQRSTIKILLEQHIVLLTILYMQSSMNEELSDVAKSSLNLIEEFVHFMPLNNLNNNKNNELHINRSDIKVKSTKSLTVHAFANIGAEQALQVIHQWNMILKNELIAVLFDDRLDLIHSTKNCNVSDEFNVCGVFNFPHLYAMDYPPLPLIMISMMMLNPFFGRYPKLLPRIAANSFKNIEKKHQISLNTIQKFSNANAATDLGKFSMDKTHLEMYTYRPTVKYTQAEDFLIMIGYYQWDNQWPTLQLNLLPTRNYIHMKSRFYNHTRTMKIPNGDIFNLPTTHIVQRLEQYPNHSVDYNDWCCIYHNDLIDKSIENIPKWVTESKIAGLMEFVHINNINSLKFYHTTNNNQYNSRYALVECTSVAGCVGLLGDQYLHQKKYTMGTTLIPFVTNLVDSLKNNPKYPNRRFKDINECYHYYKNNISNIKECDSSVSNIKSFKNEKQPIQSTDLCDFSSVSEYTNAINFLVDYIKLKLETGNDNDHEEAIDIVSYMMGSKCAMDEIRFWNIYINEYENIQMLYDYYSQENVDKFLHHLSHFENESMEDFISSIDIDWETFCKIPFKCDMLDPSIFELIRDYIKGNLYCKLNGDAMCADRFIHTLTPINDDFRSFYNNDELQIDNINKTLENTTCYSKNDPIINKYKFLNFHNDNLLNDMEYETNYKKNISGEKISITHDIINNIKNDHSNNTWTNNDDMIIINKVELNGYNAETFGFLQNWFEKTKSCTINEIHDRYLKLVLSYYEKIH